jgi:hypothetical protein
MIGPQTRLRLARVPLARIVVTECQPRYPERALHYVALLRDESHVAAYAGVVSLAFQDVTFQDGLPLYTLLDGHHRFVAAILAGRSELLALIHLEPGQPGYDRVTPLGDDLEALALLDDDGGGGDEDAEDESAPAEKEAVSA